MVATQQQHKYGTLNPIVSPTQMHNLDHPMSIFSTNSVRNDSVILSSQFEVEVNPRLHRHHRFIIDRKSTIQATNPMLTTKAKQMSVGSHTSPNKSTMASEHGLPTAAKANTAKAQARLRKRSSIGDTLKDCQLYRHEITQRIPASLVHIENRYLGAQCVIATHSGLTQA